MKRALIYILAAFSAVSCASERFTPDPVEPLINGLVTDMDENPIEHIQVTLEWKEAGITEIVYTSSEGMFQSSAYLSEENDTEVTITLEDIDGGENGGTFEKSVKTITLIQEELTADPENPEAENPISLELFFHLNHATLSESNPQS